MENIFNILKIILPAITTGLCTFLITKYTYNKNRPLDKLEIAYNRIYYPIYRLIFDENFNNDINVIIDKSKIYFIKYDKYIDISTKRLFDSLCKTNKETKRKSIYRSFKDNIYNRNSYLRRRLGYLEPSFVQLYKYSTSSAKSFFRIIIEFCVIYITIILCGITINRWNIIFNVSIIIFCIAFIFIVCEIVWCLLRLLYYKIRK